MLAAEKPLSETPKSLIHCLLDPAIGDRSTTRYLPNPIATNGIIAVVVVP
jgi:hypothetical protein